MSDADKHNLQYFEGSSMRELFDTMQAWQHEQNKRLLSVNVERDGARFCCIALTNPMEVAIVDIDEGHAATVTNGGYLHVWNMGH